MSENQELHVIFGTGPVGLAVMDELLTKGKRVRMVNRSSKGRFPAGVEQMNGDASDMSFARQASEGAAVVYQALNPPYTKWAELFPPLQKAVLEGAAAAGAKLVTLENIYMYGSTGGQPLTEETPYNPNSKKGQVRAKMAEELLAAHKSGKVRTTIGRASDFFGPRVLLSALGERVFPAALKGKAVQVIGKLDLLHSYSYMPDIGKALVILAERDEALGQAWHIPGAETITTRQFIEIIFQEVGNKSKIQVAPKLILRLIAFFNAELREVLEMIYLFEEPLILDSSKFKQSFGNHATPLQVAIRETVAWYRQHG